MQRLQVLITALFSAVISADASFSSELVFYSMPTNLLAHPIPAPSAQLVAVPGYPADSSNLVFAARFYAPDTNAFAAPYPTVLMLHGSGGLWSNDDIENGPASQFEEWGELLAEMGYAVLLPDSYNPRGIDGNFSGRRPHHDPAEDDHLCSPNYERPKDVVAALTYLSERGDIAPEAIGLVGFSHGAQTGMNALLDPSVDLGAYGVSYIDQVQDTNTLQWSEISTSKSVPAPARVPDDLPFPTVCAFYYGGGGHYGYHGSSSSTNAGRFMFDRRAKVMLFHGTDDFLMDVDDPETLPMTGNLYPIKQVLASSAQAEAEGVDDPLVHHFLLHLAEHGFDRADLAPPEDWNTNAEDPDEKAKRLCREEVLKAFETYLKPPPEPRISTANVPPNSVEVAFDTRSRSRYQGLFSTNLIDWGAAGPEAMGDGAEWSTNWPTHQAVRGFFRVESRPEPPPFSAPENTNFFKFYSDFAL